METDGKHRKSAKLTLEPLNIDKYALGSHIPYLFLEISKVFILLGSLMRYIR